MNGWIEELKRKARDAKVELPQDEVFHLLLSTACSECCDKNTGGNKTCPPPPKLTV